MSIVEQQGPLTPGIRTALQVTAVAFCVEAAHILLIIPLLQTYLPNQLHWTPAFPGYVITTYGSTRLVVQAPAGRLVDRLGPRRSATLGLAALLAAGICFALVRIPSVFLGVACLYGAGAALLWPTLFTVVADRYGRGQRGRLAAAIQIAEASGVAIGLVAGAFVVERGGVRAGFGLYLGLIAFAMLALLGTRPRLDRESASPEQTTPPATGTFRRTSLAPRFLALVAMGALLTLAPNLLTPIVRAFAVQNLKLQLHDLTGPLIPVAAIGLLAMIAAGAAADRFGRLPVTLAGLCAGAAGVWLLGGAHALPFAILAASLGAAGYLVTQPAWSAAVLDASSAERRGTQFGMVMVVQGLAEAMAPALGGKVAEAMGPGATFHLAGIVLALAAVIAAGLTWRSYIPT